MARLKNEYEFMAGVHVDGELYFNRFNLTIDFYTLGDELLDQNIGIDRLTYFIYEVAARSVFVQEEDVKSIKAFASAGVPVLTVPSPGPFDPIVLAVLVTKMNAILEETLEISDADLLTDISGRLKYVWDSSDDEDEVHLIVNAEDEAKWWASPSTRTTSYPAGTSVAEYEKSKPLQVTWEMLGLDWPSESEGEEETVVVKSSKKKDSTVIKADFNPAKPKKPEK